MEVRLSPPPANVGSADVTARSSEVKVASCNALTLRDDVRRQSYAVQARICKLGAIGFQETRAMQTDVTEKFGFVIASSACDSAGRFGCELWLDGAASWAWCGALPTTIGRDAVTILFADPRRLGVSVRTPNVSFHAFVLHSPHRSSPESASDWWQETERLCAEVGRANEMHCLYFIDANACLPEWPLSGDPPALDSRLPAHASDFVCAIVAWEAWLPSLHSRYRCGGAEHTTHYMRATGTWSAIDYVGVSSSVWIRPASCHALLEFDMQNCEADHRPTVAVVRIPVTVTDCRLSRRVPRYCRDAVYEAIVRPSIVSIPRVEAFREHMQRMPAVPYAVHPTLHAEVIQQHMLSGLVQHFPADRRKPKQSAAVTPSTFELVRHKCSVHKALCSLGRCVGQSTLQFALAHWARAALFVPPHWCVQARWLQVNSVRFLFLHWVRVVLLHQRPRAYFPRPLRQYCCVFGFVSCRIAHQWAYATACIAVLRKVVRNEIRADKVQYVEAAAGALQSAALEANVGEMFRLLRRFTARKVPRGHRLAGQDGISVTTAHEEQELFRIHFSALAAGDLTSFAALSQRAKPSRVAATGIAEDCTIFHLGLNLLAPLHL